jgi:hypothetical protein
MLTVGCTSIQDMQTSLFSLGFGPLPLFRRSGVLLSISPSVQDNNDPLKEQLGVIVPHRNGVHGCKYNSQGAGGDECCFFCASNPFYEVLFQNEFSIDQDINASSWDTTIRVSPDRAVGRTVEVGSCLLLRISAVCELLPNFRMEVKIHTNVFDWFRFNFNFEKMTFKFEK